MSRLAAASALFLITGALAACGGDDEDPLESMTACLKEADIFYERDTDSTADDAAGFVAELEVEDNGSSGEVVIFETEDDAAAFAEEEADETFSEPENRPVVEQRGAIVVTGLLVTGLGEYTAEDRQFFDKVTSCAEEAG